MIKECTLGHLNGFNALGYGKEGGSVCMKSPFWRSSISILEILWLLFGTLEKWLQGILRLPTLASPCITGSMIHLNCFWILWKTCSFRYDIIKHGHKFPMFSAGYTRCESWTHVRSFWVYLGIAFKNRKLFQNFFLIRFFNNLFWKHDILKKCILIVLNCFHFYFGVSLEK